MRTKNKKSGFTLVELMVVAAIIAILAAIIIPLMANNRERAIATEGQNICSTVATAAKVYYAEKGTWPSFAQLPQIVRNEVGNAKYFVGSGVTIGGTYDAYTITATAAANAGGLSGKTLTLNQAGTWGGTMVGTGSGQVDIQ
ncbi:MAG TPA: prepilin-type N-terminal cleavage/methylation domain-containing protein [Pontiellaceae bacterium]|nr:prepilin-type N-terminal cleavage/methylation domain-containing protein [Pontiellaceae bacterium]HPR82279.1 prepilin-type N-terminal cleavage/methylation domain-containing protein [Pontiellaceae bacterium]